VSSCSLRSQRSAGTRAVLCFSLCSLVALAILK
jgi:hypothetical protein